MNTVKLGENNKIQKKNSSRLPILTENVEVTGDNDTYEIMADRIAKGGESEIYKAKRKSDGEIVIVKVYSSYDHETQQDMEKVRNLLLNTENPADNGLLPLLDTVRIYTSSRTWDADIMPYCADGTIKSADYRELREIIIPGLIKGMSLLHKNNLVHRDIKPENIYLYNGSAVLGDFGTTVLISNDEHVTNKTMRHRGTPGYTADEVRLGYSQTAADYFSLGCTIATLYNGGEHVYAELLKRGNDTECVQNMRRSGLPLNCPDGEKDMQILVNSLTMDENTRAGYNDVIQWLRDIPEFVRKWKNIRVGTGNTFRMRFEEKLYFSEKDLTEAFLNNWEAALSFFYEDDTFYDYIKSETHQGCNEADKIRRNPPRDELDRDLCFARFLHYFNKLDDNIEPPVYWRTRKYENLSEIAKAVKDAVNNNDNGLFSDIADMLRSEFLSWKLKKISNGTDEEAGKTVEELEKKAKTQTFLSLRTFALLIEKANKIESGNADSIVWEIISNKEIMYKLCVSYYESSSDKKMLENIFGTVFEPLILKGYSEDVFKLENMLRGEKDRLTRITGAYCIFEDICRDKKNIRRRFYEYGPHSHLYWFAANIDSYEVYSDQMRGTVSKIESCVFSDTMPIGEQIKLFARLKTMRDEMHDNMLLPLWRTAIDDRKGKTVRAKKPDACFIEIRNRDIEKCLLSDIEFPIGYYRYLGYSVGKDYPENGIIRILDEAAADIKNAISDMTVNAVFERKRAGLTWLFREYCQKEFAKGNVLHFAADLMSSVRSCTSEWGKVISKTKSPAYFCLLLYELIDDVVKNTPGNKFSQEDLNIWKEQGKTCAKLNYGEYERLLQENSLGYDVLAGRNPSDYRPIWFKLKEETYNFDAEAVCSNKDGLKDTYQKFNQLQGKFNTLAAEIMKKKMGKIARKDFSDIVDCLINAKAEWEKLLKEFDAYNRGISHKFLDAKSKAGDVASDIQREWDRYKASIVKCRELDCDKELQNRRMQMWEAFGLCRKCGASYGIFGKCKNKNCGEMFFKMFFKINNSAKRRQYNV